MPLDCRLILDGPGDGAWNMAVDEALLESAAAGGGPTLRLYRWCEPTLSLGYFQGYAERAGHPASAALPCVRRSTGGGALVHDRELTYSLTLPPLDASRFDPAGLYCLAHRGVIAGVAALGGDASRLTLCDPGGPDAAGGPAALLCFQRRAKGDLLVVPPLTGAIDGPPQERSDKVGGSAQRKRAGALLQHGSVLLAESAFAPELPGLRDLGVLGGAGDTPAVLEAEGRVFAEALASGLGLRLRSGALNETEVLAAKRLKGDKHGTAGWVQRR